MGPPPGYTRLGDGTVQGFVDDRRDELQQRRLAWQASRLLFPLFVVAALVCLAASLAEPKQLFMAAWIGFLAGRVYLDWRREPPERWREFALWKDRVVHFDANGQRTRALEFDPNQLEVRREGISWGVVHRGEPVGPRRRTETEARRDRRFVLQHFGCEDPEPQPLVLNEREGALQCTYCSDAIDSAPLRCSACSAAVHSECAQEQPGCTTIGCGGHFLTPLTRVRVES